MGRASAAKGSEERRQKIEAQRAAAQRAQTRNRLLTAGGAISVVIVVAVVLIVVKATSSSVPPAPVDPTGKALSSLIATTTSVPTATLDRVGAGSGSGKPVSITGTRLTVDGKPEVVYIGAEYCPYCAAERWAMVVALSRFGTFSGLAATHSSAASGAGTAEPYAYTRTLTFAGAGYESKYLSFASTELNSNVPDKATGGYVTLQRETPAEQALMSKYDAPPYVPSDANGSIPFVDFANKYLNAGSSFNPVVLSGLSWTQIAANLHRPSSRVAKAIDGTANYISAALCGLTGDRPASACTPTVRGLQHNI